MNIMPQSQCTKLKCREFMLKITSSSKLDSQSTTNKYNQDKSFFWVTRELKPLPESVFATLVSKRL